MKSMMLIHLLLLLSLVIHEAQGVRFIRKGSLTNSQQSASHNTLAEINGEDVVEKANSMWKSKHFSGKARKLMEASSISTTTSIAENENYKKEEKRATKEENLSVETSSKTEQRQRQPAAAAETYPDILDIAGMDYSQARRKPPIHN